MDDTPATQFITCVVHSGASHRMQVADAVQWCLQEEEPTDLEPWRPYERSFAENSILLPFIPRRFYQWRWYIMNHNPLCWRVPGGRFTWGELCITSVLALQLLWFLLQWAIDPGMRTNVRTTGTCVLCLLLPGRMGCECTTKPCMSCAAVIHEMWSLPA